MSTPSLRKDESSPQKTGESNNSSSSSCDEATCHMLPCNIEFEGMAKTHVFFKPIHVENGVFATSFRGRGLLAMKEEEGEDKRNDIRGHHPYLLSMQENQIQVKASINSMMEWHHEHSLKSMNYKGENFNRLESAREWMELSNAMHEPLPVDD